MTTTPPGSRTILRAAFRTLRGHPRLLWFPIIGGLGSIAMGCVGASIAWIGQPSGAEITVGRGAAVGGILGVVLLQMWSLISAVALSSAAMEAMAGRPWTTRGAIGSAMRRLGAIATVAIAQAGVGRLLGRGKKKSKRGFLARFTTNIWEMAWWAATYLIVPVLAKEGRGGLGSVLRSAKLFRKTWKEAFVGRLALGWIWMLFVVIAIAPAAVSFWKGATDPRFLVAAIATPVVAALLGAAVLRALDIIYRSALYVFATEGVIPEPFDEPDLHAVFRAS